MYVLPRGTRIVSKDNESQVGMHFNNLPSSCLNNVHKSARERYGRKIGLGTMIPPSKFALRLPF